MVLRKGTKVRLLPANKWTKERIRDHGNKYLLLEDSGPAPYGGPFGLGGDHVSLDLETPVYKEGRDVSESWIYVPAIWVEQE